MIWTSKTISKALYLKAKGKSVLNAVRNNFAPLPCLKTLNTHIKHIKFQPGICDTNLKILLKKSENLSEPENYFYLAFDEISTIPGISKDPSTNLYMGSITLPHNKEILSDQLLLFVVMGLKSSRIKSNIAYHFTKKGVTTGEDLKKFIFEIVVRVENETNIQIKGLAFDLSALDCSMLKQFGIKFNIENSSYFITHPNRKDDVLLLSPDGTHKALKIVIF